MFLHSNQFQGKEKNTKKPLNLYHKRSLKQRCCLEGRRKEKEAAFFVHHKDVRTTKKS